MSDPEEDDMLEDADSGMGDGDRSTREDKEEDKEEDFFDAGQGTASNQLSIHAASGAARAEAAQRTIPLVPLRPRRANNRQWQHDLSQSDHS